MFDAENRAVIFDFDSCQRVGEKLGLKAGTEGWTMSGIEVAEFSNDFYALSLIRDFLSSSTLEKDSSRS